MHGIWSEQPWGGDAEVEYTKQLRKAFDSAGFTSTAIVGSDGTLSREQIAALARDTELSAAVPVLGAHYPCAHDQPEAVWDLRPAKHYWASEDFSTQGGDWNGAGCWGRSMLQNFVKGNATSTIAWSTLWAVYDSWSFFGSGFIYATQPWRWGELEHGKPPPHHTHTSVF